MPDSQNAWKEWENKLVFIQLKNLNNYNGKITSVQDAGNGLVFINMLDKFGKLVTFTSGEIKLIQEKN